MLPFWGVSLPLGGKTRSVAAIAPHPFSHFTKVTSTSAGLGLSLTDLAQVTRVWTWVSLTNWQGFVGMQWCYPADTEYRAPTEHPLAAVEVPSPPYLFQRDDIAVIHCRVQ